MWIRSIVLCFVMQYSFGADRFSHEMVKEVASSLNKILSDWLDRNAGRNQLSKGYNEYGSKVKLVELDGKEIVHQMASDLTQRLQKKMDALKILSDAAEEVIENYKVDPELSNESVEWVNMNICTNYTKEWTKGSDGSLCSAFENSLEYSDKFKRKVNFSFSGVHIPVEVFAGNYRVVNGLKWSSALDKVFKENLKHDPNLLWQYFASRDGFMRMYPATKWIEVDDQPELFDVRQRSWFLHGSSSPKDIVILVDVSGSMHGQTMSILRMSVKVLLHTLQANDFVNVAHFRVNASWIPCFDTLVPATYRNKLALSAAVDSLKECETANLTAGLEFAFNELKNFQETKSPWAGANCNQIIILLSDGGTDDIKPIFQSFNLDRKVRVFSYAVGAHPVPIAVLKDIACYYRGYFTMISSMGSIRTGVQEYMKVVSRPMSLSNAKDYQWTNFYLDNMGLGMMTIVTLPVYNKTKDDNQPTLVGVMGVDVRVKEMSQTEPKYKLGFVGYSYLLTRNGFVAFHPNLNIELGHVGYFLSLKRTKPDTVDPKETQSNYLHDPPNVNILEIETDDQDRKEIRKDMVDLKTGARSVVSVYKLPKGKYIAERNMTYFYTPVNGTSFSLAVVMPAKRTHFFNYEQSVNVGLDLEYGGIDSVILAPWKYCHDMVLEGKMEDIVENISATLRSSPELCDKLLTQRLVWDVQKTKDLMHFWKTEDDEQKRNDIIATFATTDSGLTRVYPTSEKERIFAEVREPQESIFLIKASEAESYVVTIMDQDSEDQVLETPTANSSFDQPIIIGRSITAKSTHKSAVLGLVFSAGWLQTKLKQLERKHGHSYLCENTDETICYLLDDGAFLISTNQLGLPDVFGKFFGKVDPELMEALYQKKVFKRIEEYNYADQCYVPESISTGTRTAHLPLQGILHSFNLGWLLDMAAWENLKIWLYSLFGSMFWPTASSDSIYGLDSPRYKICVTKQARYYINTEKSNLMDTIECNNCTRHYSVVRVGKSNLILVVSSHLCASVWCDAVPEPFYDTIEVADYNHCNEYTEVPYRRRPEKCYDNHTMEDNSYCSATSKISLPYLSFVIELVGFAMLKMTFRR